MKEYLIKQLDAINLQLDDTAIDKIIAYHKLMIEWNKKLNLTRITDDIEAVDKHYIDSLSIFNTSIIEKSDFSLIDVGTGAGLPGIPIAIICPNAKITLIDSLNKKIKFIEAVKYELDIDNIECFHGRAEDIARLPEHREKYDYACARAVAALPVLAEYLLPFVKIGGKAICYKAACDDFISSKNALRILGAPTSRIIPIKIPNMDWERNIVVMDKKLKTSELYPRKAGTPVKNPL